MSTGRIIFIIGSVLILLSMLLPWLDIDVADIKSMGYETDGIFVGILGVAALVIGFTYKGSKEGKPYSIAGFFGAIISLIIIFFIDRRHIRLCFDEMQSYGIPFYECTTYVGNGLFIAGLGSILQLIGSLIPTKIREQKE